MFRGYARDNTQDVNEYVFGEGFVQLHSTYTVEQDHAMVAVTPIPNDMEPKPIGIQTSENTVRWGSVDDPEREPEPGEPAIAPQGTLLMRFTSSEAIMNLINELLATHMLTYGRYLQDGDYEEALIGCVQKARKVAAPRDVPDAWHPFRHQDKE